MRYSFKDISSLLAQDAERIVSELLPQGKKEGKEWRVGSLYGERGSSLGVHLVGEKSGIWSDFATGEGGDLLDLWSKVKKITPKEAITAAKTWLGIKENIPNLSKLGTSLTKTFVRPRKAPQTIISHSKVFTYLQEERRLSLETLQKYQVAEHKILDKKTGKTREMMIFPYIRDGEVIMNKCIFLDRPGGKKEMFTSKDAEPCLFGWHMVSQGARSVAIFEGELDAMTGYQYKLQRFNAISKIREPIGMLSVPRGGGGGNKQEWIEYEFERLIVYDEIFLVLDTDATGQEASREIIARLGRHRCSVVKLPHKDVNECLQKGVSQEEIQKCFDGASPQDPQELVSIKKYSEKIKEQFFSKKGEALSSLIGYLPPWPLEDSDLIFKQNELSVWTGINGHGKSQLLGHIALGCVTQGARVCVASLELKPQKLGERLYRQLSAKRLVDEQSCDEISNYLEKKLYLFDHVGETNIERLIEVFTYAHCRYGVDVFVIDSLMKCGILGDDYNQQKLFLDKLCAFKNTYACHVHLVAHPRKSDNESAAPGKMDIKGSGDITDLADNCFSIWRNVVKEEKLQSPALKEQERREQQQYPDCILRCLKRRDGEWSGQINLWFDKDSLQYLPGFNQQALPLLDNFSQQDCSSEEYEYGDICEI